MSQGRALAVAPPSPGGGSAAYSEDEDECTDELIDRILENYQFHFKPETRVKLKQRLNDMSIGACYSKPWGREPRWRFTLKPAAKDAAVGKYVRSLLVIPAMSTAAVFSSKIQLSVFRLQFVASYNWQRRAPSLEYRLTTKWSDGPRIKRKERFQVSDRCHVRCKWNLEAHLPDMEGHVGGGGNAVDVDYGSLMFDISQLDVCLDIS
ncbi:hypothetical protein MNEG_13640 [Monoraphidium neglectum]|uniref:DUF7781 domain-containing protein n=1 Tax=Monoraphidium neglectum TaxID=145388 RepID=A0A0D2J2W0_9CHLO|nr:hypothetical protein MNEG_13640 [Monoraphidium neglectum]KIY94322.1 hypothetical protein MNEG_13640 [Monoraphidium neglectum]|eukprot:XP_013893342.1 hypothetical protein MNEG_13640 [Monoraphidium neglectum]